MAVWDAEITVDEALVRTLLQRFPELALDSVEPLSEGWDRSTWRVDGTWAFGFPRRAVVVPGLERELALLPRLAPLLPLAVPNPSFVGAPSDEFPWPFFGSAFLPGEEAGELASDDRRAVGLELAGFLRRLHGAEVAAVFVPEELPLDANARADMQLRVPRTRAALAELGTRAPDFTSLLDEAERLSPSREVAVVHGDLHPRQVLVDGPRVSGVIDWIDLGRADPAVDLNVVWSFVEPEDRASFLAAYGAVTEEQLIRARVVAVWVSAAIARSASDLGLRQAELDALTALERAAIDQ